jgi:hypothetical protein
VQIRSAEHKVCASLADLDAIFHQTDVMRVGMLTTLMKAVLDRFETEVVAGGTLLNAATHFFGHVMVSH